MTLHGPAETKEALREARQSLSLLQATLESTTDGILVVDLHGRIVLFNQRFAEMWRIPRGILETRDDDRALAVASEQLAEPALFLDKVRELYATPEAESFDVLTFRDGRVFERRSRPQLLLGRPVGRVWSFRDATERYRSERLQRATYRISESAYEARSLEDLFRILHGIVSELMPARNFYIALHDRQRDILTFPYFVDEHDAPPAPKPPGRGLTEYVLRTGQPLLASPDVFEALVGQGEVESIGAPSVDWLGIPLRTARGTIGVVVVQTYTEGVRFRDADRGLLAFVSTQLAMAIERKAAEEALAKSELYYRSLIENALDVTAVFSTDGVLLFVSPSVERVLGFRPDELLGSNGFDIVHPDDRAEVVDTTRRVLRDGTRVEPFEYRVRHRDGTWRDIAAIGKSLPPETGIRGLILNARDITERRRGDEALRESEERFRQAFEFAGVGMALLSIDGRWLRINRVLCEMLGYSEDELRKTTFQELTHPDDLSGNLDEARRVVTGQIPYMQVEKRYRHRDGHYVSTRLTTSVVRSAKGEPGYFVSQIEDITERKRAEEALAKSELYYRSLIENAVDITAVLSPDGHVLYATPSTERILGYPAEERLGRSFMDLIHPEDRSNAEERLRRNLTEGSSLRAHELRLRHRDGSWRTLSVIGKPLPPETGMRGLIINARDITEPQQLEAQLRHAQKMEAVGRLAGGVAHDFNNVLTVIQGYGEMLSMSLGGDEVRREQAAEILKAAERAATLTRQLLAFSRRQMLEMRVLDLGAVVGDTEKMLRRLIGEDIELVVTNPGHPVFVKVDPGQIDQILLNLAVNSRDAMPAGGKLTIELSEVDLDAPVTKAGYAIPAGGYVVLSVSDTGSGMDADTLTHLFEPFFTTKEVGKGTGLGLATVYGIVKQSGGYITVESTVGRGTTFRIFLAREAGNVPRARITAAPAPSGTETILVVEDADSVRTLTCHLLQAAGYTVLNAGSPEEALRLAERLPGPIDLLLTDVVMPNMGGYELATRLSTVRPKLGVLLMTGYSPDVAAHEAAVGRGWHYLQKPFTAAALRQAVRDALSRLPRASSALP